MCCDTIGISMLTMFRRRARSRRARRRRFSPACCPDHDIDKMDYLYRDSLHAGVPLRPTLRPAAPAGSLCSTRAATAWRSPTKARRRPAHGFRPLRHVQRSLLAPRRPRRHGHAPTSVGTARSISIRCSGCRSTKWSTSCSGRLPVAPPANCLMGSSGRRGGSTKTLLGNTASSKGTTSMSVWPGVPYPWLAACAERFSVLVSSAIGAHEVPVRRTAHEARCSLTSRSTSPGDRPLGEVSR